MSLSEHKTRVPCYGATFQEQIQYYDTFFKTFDADLRWRHQDLKICVALQALFKMNLNLDPVIQILMSLENWCSSIDLKSIYTIAAAI